MEDKKLKTGTTTVGMIYNGGIVLAAEKKATIGYMVDSKVAKKIHKLDGHIGLTIAGSVGDAQSIIRLMIAQFKLYKLERGPISGKAAATLLSNILQGSKYYPYYNQFVLAVFDSKGPHIYSLDPLGGVVSDDSFYSTGSGSPFAYGVLEHDFEEGMTEKDAIVLAIDAVKSAIQRDIASGGKGFTVVVIDKDGFRELSESEIQKLN